MFLQKFMVRLSLRQGAILIAIVQLISLAFVMVFFALALDHTINIQEMVARDTEDVLERESYDDFSFSQINTKRMDLANRSASETMYVVNCSLIASTINFFITVLLLYGALMESRYFMVPWMFSTSLILITMALVIFYEHKTLPFLKFFGEEAIFLQRIIVVFLLLKGLYVLYVVVSYYKSLEKSKAIIIHQVHSSKRYLVPELVTKNKCAKPVSVESV